MTDILYLHCGVGAVHATGGGSGSIKHVCSWTVTDFRRPVSQPVIDGYNDGVFQEFRENHEEDHEEPPRRQVTPAHLREQHGS